MPRKKSFQDNGGGFVAKARQVALAALKGVAARFSGSGGNSYSGGRGGWAWGWLPGAKFDYLQEAGDLWLNSAVMSAIKWATRAIAEAPPAVFKPAKNGPDEMIPGHALLKRLKKPNKFYSGRILWAGTVLSLMVDGNAYWLKVRDAAGKVAELWYVPHWMMEPRWPQDGSEFISHYDYLVDGKAIRAAVTDVVHFRDGVDPANIRKGLGALASVLREVCADNALSSFAASILRNKGFPGVYLIRVC